MKVYTHNGVVCAQETVNLLGSKLDIYVYAVNGILIDTGPSRFAERYSSFFSSQPIEQVVLTHFHEDHTGNAHWLEKQGLPVFIHPASIPLCRKHARLPLYRRIFWGKRLPFSPSPLTEILEGERAKWEVIEVSGHSFDHIALFDPGEGRVFTGDLFVTPKPKIIMNTECIPEIMRSLEVLLQKDFKTVYCGHAGVIEDGKAMIAKKLDFLNNLKMEVLQLYRKGWSIKDINKKMFPKKLPLTYFSAKEWASEHMIRSIIMDE